MLISPIITEKTMMLAKDGKYTFSVEKGLTKYDIKKLIEELFGVNVVRVRTMRTGPELKMSTRSRKKRLILPVKKTIVELAEKQKLDIFEEKKGK